MTRKKKKSHLFFRKVLALFLSVSFLCSNLTLHAESLERSLTSRHEVTKEPWFRPNTFEIPQELGTIEEKFASKRTGAKTIIYVQDAHDSFEAQENIAGIINHTVTHYGVKTVFEEGYEGLVPTDEYFSFIQNPKVKEKTSYFLMDKLRIGGAEYAHINRIHDFKLIGADSIMLHFENNRQYKKARRRQGEIRKELSILKNEIRNLANRFFPTEFKSWLKLKERFDLHQIDLLPYLKQSSLLVTDVNQYANISILLLENQDAASTIEAKTLFEEIDRFEIAIAARFLQSKRNRKLFEYYQGLNLMSRLNQIEITPAEFEAVQDRLQKLKTSEMVNFIARESHKSLVASRKWEESIRDAVRFYEISKERDQAIAKRFDEFLRQPDEQAAVLVFGGFHKDQIRKVLREKGFSYLIVSPKISTIDPVHQLYYKRLMSVGRHPFEAPLPIARASRIASRPYQLGLTPAGDRLARAELRVISDVIEKNPSAVNVILDHQITEVLSSSLVNARTFSRSEARSNKDQKSNRSLNDRDFLQAMEAIAPFGRLPHEFQLKNISMDGQWFGFINGSHTVNIYHLGSRRNFSIQAEDIVSDLAFSPDGKRLKLQIGEGYGRTVIRIFDLERWRYLNDLIGEYAVDARFSPSGKYGWIKYSNGAVKLYDLQKRQTLRIADRQGATLTLSEPNTRFQFFDEPSHNFSSNEKYAVCRVGAHLMVISTDSNRALPLSFRTDYASAGFENNILMVYYRDSSMEIHDPDTARTQKLSHVQRSFISKTGKYIGVSYKKGLAFKIFDLQTQLPITLGKKIVEVRFFDNDKKLLVIAKGGALTVVDLLSLQKTNLPFLYTDQMWLSEYEFKIGTLTSDRRSFQITNLTTNEGMRLVVGEGVSFSYVSPNEKLVCFRYGDGSFKMFDMETGKEISPIYVEKGSGNVHYAANGGKVWFDRWDDRGRQTSFKYYDNECINKNPLLNDAATEWGDSSYFGIDLLSLMIREGLIKDVTDFRTYFEFLLPEVKRFDSTTTNYNRGRLVEQFTQSDILRHLIKRGADIRRHLSFYFDLIGENKRLALQILEGIFESIAQGAVSIELPDAEKQQIREFIARTNNFSLPLFLYYKNEGSVALNELLAFGQTILRDEVGSHQLNEFAENLSHRGYDGDAILLAVAQQVIPGSGASFVKREETAGLFKKYREAGDRRDDIPDSLKRLGRFGGGTIQIHTWRLKPGERYDPEKRVQGLIESLHYPDSGKSKEQVDKDITEDRIAFVKALQVWVNDTMNMDKRRKALQTFLAYASHNDQLREKVDRIQTEDYVSLDMLDQLFRDKDNLSVLLRAIMSTTLHLKASGTFRDAVSFKKALFGLWSSGRSPEEKQQQLAKQLASVDAQELLTHIIGDAALPIDLRDAVKVLIEKRGPMTEGELISALFEEPLNQLEAEKAKFEDVISEKSVSLKFQVVKGPAYGIYGLCSGVCIATDLELWKKRDFYLLAMIDETSGMAVGFNHLFARTIKGNRHLTVPGIEPSTEFLGHVKAADVYPMIQDALVRVAEAGGFAENDLPTDANILSNRKDIYELAIKQGYTKEKLPRPIIWNALPKPYPFRDVYVMWRRPATQTLINEEAFETDGTLKDRQFPRAEIRSLQSKDLISKAMGPKAELRSEMRHPDKIKFEEIAREKKRVELRQTQTKGTFLIRADSLIAMRSELRDELFSTLYVHRRELRLIVYGDQNKVSNDPALNATLRLPNVRLVSDFSHQSPGVRNELRNRTVLMLVASPEEFQPTKELRQAVLIREPGAVEAARLLLEGGELRGIVGKNGVFDPPAEFLAELVRSELRYRVIAYAA